MAGTSLSAGCGAWRDCASPAAASTRKPLPRTRGSWRSTSVSSASRGADRQRRSEGERVQQRQRAAGSRRDVGCRCCGCGGALHTTGVRGADDQGHFLHDLMHHEFVAVFTRCLEIEDAGCASNVSEHAQPASRSASTYTHYWCQHEGDALLVCDLTRTATARLRGFACRLRLAAGNQDQALIPGSRRPCRCAKNLRQQEAADIRSCRQQ